MVEGLDAHLSTPAAMGLKEFDCMRFVKYLII